MKRVVLSFVVALCLLGQSLLADIGLPIAVRVNSAAYEASHVLRTKAGVLMTLQGYNSGPAQFIQLFDSITVPANGVAPIWVQAVAATSNFTMQVPTTGMPFTTGLAVSNSTTGPTKTLGASDCYFTAVVK
jgi:hypothetical protein